MVSAASSRSWRGPPGAGRVKKACARGHCAVSRKRRPPAGAPPVRNTSAAAARCTSSLGTESIVPLICRVCRAGGFPAPFPAPFPFAMNAGFVLFALFGCCTPSP
ncbi:hypothetical protein GCM10010218_26690 [Streptomyces mashuensis]|uniref:Uncharacterized protein n=1 Tax=Streptomyces mashuensis TaxID=33904 RepID=A0A919B2T9_9ACTN|nr:hypothetical protein GCM10010218_26690 [Streptomyces mashuensis]